MDRKASLLYAQLNQFKNLVKWTHEFIEYSLQKVKSPYLACSFGKDSIVMLHLVLKHCPEIPVLWVTFKETRMINNYDEVVQCWLSNYNLNLTELFVDVDVDAEYDDKQAMFRFAKKNGYDSAFVGIRKEEDRKRKHAINRYGKIHKLNPGQIRIAPLSDWTYNDISAYIYSHGLKYLESYDCDGMESRTTTGIPDSDIRHKDLARLRRQDMSAYNRLIAENPNLKKFI